MANTLDSFLGVHEAALRLRAARTEMLASNIANADTPNYKARDIDFQSALQEYMGTSVGVGVRNTHAGHMGGAEIEGNVEALYRVPTQPSIDGNTVDVQTEKAAFMENALQYQTTLRFIDGSIKTLRSAIRGE